MDGDIRQRDGIIEDPFAAAERKKHGWNVNADRHAMRRR